MRAPRLPWVSIRHLFHVLCSSTIVLLPLLLPLRFLLGFFLSGSIPLSPQTLFFLHFFPQLPFLLQVESSHVSCFFLLCFLFPSFGSRLSFFPFFPGYSPSTPLSTFTLYPADFLLSSPISLPLPLPLPPCLRLVIQRSHS